MDMFQDIHAEDDIVSGRFQELQVSHVVNDLAGTPISGALRGRPPSRPASRMREISQALLLA